MFFYGGYDLVDILGALLLVTAFGGVFIVGYMCADIDEDEFDGPNDLSVDEWTQLDDIILYYYNIIARALFVYQVYKIKVSINS